MEFYKRLIIKILERSSVGSDNRILKKVKKRLWLDSKGNGWTGRIIRTYFITGLFFYNFKVYLFKNYIYLEFDK